MYFASTVFLFFFSEKVIRDNIFAYFLGNGGAGKCLS